MVVNSLAVTLFAIALATRTDDASAPEVMTLALEGAGVALLGIGGWMGGTLAFRNQIGVDHRYADAGKWNEESFDAVEGKPVAVAKPGELQVNQMKLLHVRIDDESRRIVLARTEEGHVAFDDRCTHKGASLADGALICGTVHCPWHGSHFDVRSGAVKAGPAEEKIGTYAVEERDGKVHVIIST